MARMREVSYVWHLRKLMAQREMYSTTDLAPLLAVRGVQLSAPQIYRLVTGTPERLNMHVLAALCDALECTPTDLIETTVIEVGQRRRKTASATAIAPSGVPGEAGGRAFRPTRAVVLPEE